MRKLHLLPVLLLVLGACQATPAASAPPSASRSPAAVIVSGDDGVALALAAGPAKIVSLTPATSELAVRAGRRRPAGRPDGLPTTIRPR